MKISVITATYNSAHTLRPTIESFLIQNYPNKEYVVIDGGSNDGTLPPLSDYRQHIDVLHSGPDKGIYDALNKGIHMASGDVVGFLHSDDVYASSDVLAAIAEAFACKDVDAVYGDLCYVAQGNTEKVIRYWKSEPFQPSLLRKGWMPPHPTLFIRKDIYLRYGLYKLDYSIAADYELILRYFGMHGIRTTYLPMVVTKMRMGGASNRFSQLFTKIKEDYRALKSNGMGGVYTLAYKNISKIPQFLVKS